MIEGLFVFILYDWKLIMGVGKHGALLVSTSPSQCKGSGFDSGSNLRLFSVETFYLIFIAVVKLRWVLLSEALPTFIDTGWIVFPSFSGSKSSFCASVSPYSVFSCGQELLFQCILSSHTFFHSLYVIFLIDWRRTHLLIPIPENTFDILQYHFPFADIFNAHIPNGRGLITMTTQKWIFKGIDYNKSFLGRHFGGRNTHTGVMQLEEVFIFVNDTRPCSLSCVFYSSSSPVFHNANMLGQRWLGLTKSDLFCCQTVTLTTRPSAITSVRDHRTSR